MSNAFYTSAEEVEAAFYEALAHADLDAMMALWSEDEEVICVHPGGQRLHGLSQIRESWRQLFESGTRLIVRTTHLVAHNTMMLSVHSVLEHLAVEGNDRFVTPLVATNVYSRGATGWRMVVHHASPQPDVGALSGQMTPNIVH